MGNFKETARLVSADKSMTTVMWGQIWSSHQRFFKYLCLGAKGKRALVGSGLLVEAAQDKAFYDVESMNKFLNSIIGMLAAILNSLFEYFTNMIEAVVAQAKKSGSYDPGILDVGAVGDTIKSIDSSKFLFKNVRI